MPFQRIDKRRQKWDQSFGADPIGGIPDEY